jgi:hypothetical protein
LTSNVEFFAPPKSLKRLYKQTEYTLTYIPDLKQWGWEVTFVHKTKYGDTAKSMNAAQKAAEKHIDQVLSLRGK